jgi:pimeloyl-ACP methyl ester carboxylesterase
MRRDYSLWCAFLLCVFLTGCFPTVHLEPQLTPVVLRVNVLEVQSEYTVLDSYDEPATPDSLDKAMFLRYYLSADTVDTVLILMPGIFNGATNLDILARQLVAGIPHLQVWVVDRRANLLEDRSRFISSLQKRDPMIAYNYYVSNAGLENGFNAIAPNALRFMAEWGLETHLRDLHEVVKVAHESAPTVVLGGYSLGASIVSYYASFLFDEGAGQTQLDGLLLIDGGLGITGGFDREPTGLTLGPLELMPGLEELEQGTGSPYFTRAFSPDQLAKGQVSYLLARFEPDALSPGKDRAFPATNRAVLGIANDDNVGPSVIFGWSVGEPVGATLSGNLLAVLSSGQDGVYSQSVTGVARGHDYVDWTRADEVCDMDAYTRAAATFDTDSSEWYFPVRLALDVGSYEIRLEHTPDFLPTRLITLPTLAVGAERGLAPDLDTFSAYNNARPGSSLAMYVLPDYTHADIVQAESNPLVSLIQVWLSQR